MVARKMHHIQKSAVRDLFTLANYINHPQIFGYISRNRMSE